VGRFDFFHVSVIHVDNAITVFEHAAIVRHNDDGAVGIKADLPHELHHRLTGFGIQGGRRFVTNEQPGRMDQGPGDRHPLLLAAGELRRVTIEAIGEADRSQNFLGAFHGHFAVCALDQEGDRGVLRRRQRGQQVVLLNDKANVVGAESYQAVAAQLGQGLAQHGHIAATRLE